MIHNVVDTGHIKIDNPTTLTEAEVTIAAIEPIAAYKPEKHRHPILKDSRGNHPLKLGPVPSKLPGEQCSLN